MTPAHLLPRWALCLTTLLSLWAGVVWAGQIIVHLPDERIKEAITNLCSWHHCQSEANGGEKTDEAQLEWVTDQVVKAGSFGHYDSLHDIQGSLEVRYDAP